jgi:hypothetical protein
LQPPGSQAELAGVQRTRSSSGEVAQFVGQAAELAEAVGERGGPDQARSRLGSYPSELTLVDLHCLGLQRGRIPLNVTFALLSAVEKAILHRSS